MLHGRRWPALVWVAAAAVAVALLAVDADHFLLGTAAVMRLPAAPGALAVSPDGRTVYLADSTGSVIPVPAATRKPGRPIPVSDGMTGNFVSGKLAVTPDGRTMFALLIGDGPSPPPRIARLDLRTGRETGQVEVPGGVRDYALSRDGRVLYVLAVDDAVIAVSAATGRPERRIPAPHSLQAGELAMIPSPDGTALYLASAGVARGGAVTPVDLRTGAVGGAVNVGWEPLSLAITPDGRTLYTAVNGMMGESGQGAPNQVVVIDTAADRVRAVLPWRVPAQSLAMAPGGATVWVVSTTGEKGSTADNTVTPVSVASGRPGAPLRTSGWLNDRDDAPSEAVVSCDGRTMYVTVEAGLETFALG